jgi:pimeloyl-ACP methyl ester carboxylesterase
VNVPLVIAEQGYFWVGVSRSRQQHGTVVGAAMYVQYQIPAEIRHPYPVVMVHGGGGQGTDWLGTPDGRPGWATRFLEHGYPVYVVDRPGFGRSPCHPDVIGPPAPPPTYERLSAMFSAPASARQYPQARLHTQWPGSGEIGDPALDQFAASQAAIVADMAWTHRQMQSCGAELLDRIGPAVLMTHSMGGAFGWVVADARPGLVKGIVAVEPVGPPFVEGLLDGRHGLPWGITAIPLTYDPPASDPSELARELRPAPGPGLLDCYVQTEPARQLPHLTGFPIVVVTAEASWIAQTDHGIVDFLVQAGANAEHLRLEEAGVHGNGHIMMGEKNSDEVVQVIFDWLDAHVKNQ